MEQCKCEPDVCCDSCCVGGRGGCGIFISDEVSKYREIQYIHALNGRGVSRPALVLEETAMMF